MKYAVPVRLYVPACGAVLDLYDDHDVNTAIRSWCVEEGLTSVMRQLLSKIVLEIALSYVRVVSQ